MIRTKLEIFQMIWVNLRFFKNKFIKIDIFIYTFD